MNPLSPGLRHRPGDDQLVAAEITPDVNVLLAGNAPNLAGLIPALAGCKPVTLCDGNTGVTGIPPTGKGDKRGDKNAPAPGSSGFILLLSADGQKVLTAAQLPGALVCKLCLNPEGNVYVLVRAIGTVRVVGESGGGTFIARLSPDARKVAGATVHEADDFGVDANGEIVLLAGKQLVRLSADGRTEKWTARWASHGDSRPGAMTLPPQTGAAVVVGHGMTKTGHEPYKDPYAYGFDRAGRQAWALGNPGPTREAGPCSAATG